MRSTKSNHLFAVIAALFMAIASSAIAEEKIYSIERNIRSGDDVIVDIPNRIVHRVEVLLKRLQKDHTDCYITVGLTGQALFEGGKHAQVDREDLHELTLMGGDRRAKEHNLQVRAHNGDVYVHEIVVHFK